MPLKRPIRDFILSAFFLRLLALALLNPLCCHYLPTFDAEPPQHEYSIAENESECTGKPDSVPAIAKAPVFTLAVLERLPLSRKIDPAPVPGLSPNVGYIRCNAPPVHIRFRVFLS